MPTATSKCVHEYAPKACATTIDTFIHYNLIKNLETALVNAKTQGVKRFELGGHNWDVRFTELLVAELKKEKLDAPKPGYPT